MTSIGTKTSSSLRMEMMPRPFAGKFPHGMLVLKSGRLRKSRVSCQISDCSLFYAIRLNVFGHKPFLILAVCKVETSGKYGRLRSCASWSGPGAGYLLITFVPLKYGRKRLEKK